MSDSDSGRELINIPKCPFLKIFLVYREYQNRKVPKIILLTIFLLFSYIMPHFYLLLFALRKSICFLRKVTIRQSQNQFFKNNYNILENGQIRIIKTHPNQIHHEIESQDYFH